MKKETKQENKQTKNKSAKTSTQPKVCFDNELYLKLQSENINKRIKKFHNKLYLEFGGKIFDDLHAARVLPGFDPNIKIKLLQKMKDKAEIIFCISSNDIEKNKIRADLGLSYDNEVLRLVDNMRELGLYISAFIITLYKGQPSATKFAKKLEQRGERVFFHNYTKGYPNEVETIVSDEGYGANPFVETTRPLVIVTAPGPSSGKLATCLSQLYHEYKRGVKAGYAKFETFPVWNLPLKHPVNIAYEAATADLYDVNQIDPFHFNAYGKLAVNYNRDIAVFPILQNILTRITKKEIYQSPTDMGVNMAGNCICDDEVCKEASRQEIIRRYYRTMDRFLSGECPKEETYKVELLMNQAGVTVHDRKVVDAALARAEETGAPAAALELPDGRIVTGKTSDLLGASAALILNALKELAGIDHDMHLISPTALEPIQKVKTEFLGSKNPRLHIDEALIALSISASSNPVAEQALRQVPNLKGCQAHVSVMLANVDIRLFQKLSIQVTSEPRYEKKPIYQ